MGSTIASRRGGRVAALALALALLLAGGAQALAGGVVNTTRFGNTAVDGYDAVSYFTEGKAVEGSGDFTYKWNGATWKFASQAHRDAFAAAPEKYAPQYGGYCAWAVSQGYTAGADPEVWRVVDGKLYLNYSKDVQKQWAEDVPGNIAKGDGNWPGIAKDLAK